MPHRADFTRLKSAVIYIFVAQVRTHKTNLSAFFEWVFVELMHHPAPEELEALLPANWIKTGPAANKLIEIQAA